MAREWSPDVVLPSFDSTTLELPPEDDGPLVATLVRRKAEQPTSRAVLYVHGFVDYFFQEHVAAAFNARGWNFYAIDLHRYGRSLRGGNRPNYCRDIHEYDAELTQAIDIIRHEDANETFLLMGHSTGGLIASMYASSGERREEIHGVILNSPFFGFFLSRAQALQLPVGVLIGRVLPFLPYGNALSPRYAESLHKEYGGEWDFDLSWKPLRGFPAYFGWLTAIHRAQRTVQKGLHIKCPVLLLHSSASMLPGPEGDERNSDRDIVLNIEHMRDTAPMLGDSVTVRRIAGGVHDLYLSREEVRDKALQQTFDWISSVIGDRVVTVREFRT